MNEKHRQTWLGHLTLGRLKAVAALLLLGVVVWVGLRGCGPTAYGPPPPPGAAASQPLPTTELTIDGRTFELELALTPDQRYQGLSDRHAIPADGGMLFVFPEAAHRTFVMRRCLVPIDLIFLDADGRVVRMHQMQVEPYGRPEWQLTDYDSDAPAQYAIELKGGMLNELDLSRGDRIDLPGDLAKRAQ